MNSPIDTIVARYAATMDAHSGMSEANQLVLRLALEDLVRHYTGVAPMQRASHPPLPVPPLPPVLPRRMPPVQDTINALQDAGRQGWQQLHRLNDWLEEHAPEDYHADNDTATAVLVVLNRQERIIRTLTRRRLYWRDKYLAVNQAASFLLAQRNRGTNGEEGNNGTPA